MKPQAYELSSGQITFLKWFALFAMVSDHIAFAFKFPPEWHLWLRGIGRFSFIFFAGLIVYQLNQDMNVIKKYLPRFIVFTVISQIPYVLFTGVEWWKLNVFGEFTAFIIYLIGMEKARTLHFPQAILLAAVGLMLAMISDFGTSGIIFMLCLIMAMQNLDENGDKIMRYGFLFGAVVLAVDSSFALRAEDYRILWFSLVAVILFLFAPKITPNWNLPKCHPMFFYLFYPLHLLVIIWVARSFLA